MATEEHGIDISVSSLDGIVELWTAIGSALRDAGYGDAAPEYLRLSTMLEQAHNTALLDGTLADPETWAALRQAGLAAHELLGPLAEAALTLASLPFDGESTAGSEAQPAPGPAQGPKKRRTGSTEKTGGRQRKPVRTIRATKPINARS